MTRALALLVSGSLSIAFAQTPCDNLKSVPLPDSTITAVESIAAPEAIIAAHVTGNTVAMTRPLCPYPRVAVYQGVGSTNDAASFSCKPQ